MLETLILGVTSYIGTNIDDLLVDTVFFVSANDDRAWRRILAGKYLGIAVLMSVSIAMAYGLKMLSPEYIKLLGIVPILLGVKELISSLRGDEDGEEPDVTRSGRSLILQVMIVTIANGADNIGVYTPLFAGFAFRQIAVVCGVYAAMTVLWCWVSKKIAELSVLRQFVAKYKKVIIPVVYVALGVYILME